MIALLLKKTESLKRPERNNRSFSRKRPSPISNPISQCQDRATIKIVIESYKTTGPDEIPLKLTKLSSNAVDKYHTCIINHGVSQSYFSDRAKKALVRPIYKKKDGQNKENYLPVSILYEFLKVYDRFINENMLPII